MLPWYGVNESVPEDVQLSVHDFGHQTDLDCVFGRHSVVERLVTTVDELLHIFPTLFVRRFLLGPSDGSQLAHVEVKHHLGCFHVSVIIPLGLSVSVA